MREQSLVLFSLSGRRKMENMKLFEHPEALEFDQWGEGWTWIVNTLSFSPIVPFHVYVLFQCPISGGYQLLSRSSPSTSWAIPLHPSTPIVPGGVSVWTFVARMYYFKTPVLLSTGVLVYWLSVFQCRCASFYPVNLQFVCSWPQVLYICPNDTFAFWLCLPSSILT